MIFQSTRAKKRLMKLRGLAWAAYSWVCLRFTRWNWGVLYRQIQGLNIDRLHVGCGKVLLPGWLNITYEKREEYGRIKKVAGVWWLNFNALNSLPVPDESIQYLAASHFIEHLDFTAGIRFTKEAFRVMKKCGVIHLSCPDLELYASNYISGTDLFLTIRLFERHALLKMPRLAGRFLSPKRMIAGARTVGFMTRNH